MNTLLGRKLRMTQMFTEDGRMVPITAIEVGPCPIVQVKTETSDGYNALQIGFLSKREKSSNKPELGHFKKANIGPQQVLKEIRVESVEGYEVGQNLNTSIFNTGDRIDISGISKGRGFQGGMKRHHWGGGRMTHGSMFHRRIGSIAPGTGQARIFKGKTLPGHMGNVKVTIQNLEVMKVDADNNILYVKGGIPGPNGRVVVVKHTTKNSKKNSESK